MTVAKKGKKNLEKGLLDSSNNFNNQDKLREVMIEDEEYSSR